MNNDKELLELAAKAAGLYVKREVLNHNDEFLGLRVKPSKDAGRETMVFWNPLTDDGDALRLAGALEMDLTIGLLSAEVWTTGSSMAGKRDPVCVNEEMRNDETHMAMVRRAIVRAAAEIGKGMLSHDEFVLMFPGHFPDEEVERARGRTK